MVSILYGSVQAFTQTNARLILGYSSVAQLGFITLGIFALDAAGQGAQGALLQAVNHGLVVAPLFFVIALLAERAEGSEDIRDYGGIAFRAPVLAVLFLIAALATLAMPGSANFAGEFLILLGVFNSVQAIAIIASVGVVLASVYALRMYIRSMHNRVGPRVQSFDLTLRDGLVLVPLILAIIAFALYPQLALDAGEEAIKATVQAVASDDVSDRPGDRQGSADQLGGAVARDRADRRRVHRAARRARALVVHPPQRRADADDRHARRHRRARRLAVGHQRGDRRQGAGHRQSDAGADDDLRRRRHRGRAAVLALDRRPPRPARASTTRCC